MFTESWGRNVTPPDLASEPEDAKDQESEADAGQQKAPEINPDEHRSATDARLEPGGFVSAETARRICCYAGIREAAADDGREHFTLGRKSRVPNARMRGFSITRQTSRSRWTGESMDCGMSVGYLFNTMGNRYWNKWCPGQESP